MGGGLICAPFYFKFFEDSVCKHGRNRQIEKLCGRWVKIYRYFSGIIREKFMLKIL